jgi:hypothetical protein
MRPDSLAVTPAWGDYPSDVIADLELGRKVATQPIERAQVDGSQ